MTILEIIRYLQSPDSGLKYEDELYISRGELREVLLHFKTGQVIYLSQGDEVVGPIPAPWRQKQEMAG